MRGGGVRSREASTRLLRGLRSGDVSIYKGRGSWVRRGKYASVKGKMGVKSVEVSIHKVRQVRRGKYASVKGEGVRLLREGSKMYKIHNFSDVKVGEIILNSDICVFNTGNNSPFYFIFGASFRFLSTFTYKSICLATMVVCRVPIGPKTPPLIYDLLYIKNILLYQCSIQPLNDFRYYSEDPVM